MQGESLFKIYFAELLSVDHCDYFQLDIQSEYFDVIVEEIFDYINDKKLILQ